MIRSARRLLLLLAVASVHPKESAEALDLCDPESGRPCPAVVARREAPSSIVALVAPLGLRDAAPRRSLLAVIPSPPPRTLGARLWALIQHGVRLDGTVTPSFDDDPPLPGGGKRGFDLAMVGVRVSFGETVATELWAEVVGIEMLDHSVTLDGTFRPF